MKIVINVCFGGYGLSDKAFELYLKRTKQKWIERDGGCYYTIPKKEYDKISQECYTKDGDYRNVNGKGYILLDGDIERHDKILIQIIEELGEEANGDCAELKIVEIPDGTDYVIDEYDGNESIHESHESWS